MTVLIQSVELEQVGDDLDASVPRSVEDSREEFFNEMASNG